MLTYKIDVGYFSYTTDNLEMAHTQAQYVEADKIYLLHNDGSKQRFEYYSWDGVSQTYIHWKNGKNIGTIEKELNWKG